MPHVQKEMISFFVTTECNLDCSYCYTNKTFSEHSNQTLSFSFAKAGIDDFFKENKNRHIRFFGAGEPTTKMQLLKKIYNYANERASGRLKVEIQTNGVFSLKKADWLADNIDIIWVSSDGYPEIHDYYRKTIHGKPTSKKLSKNVKYLIRNGKGITGIRSTITNDTVSKMIESLDYFASLGVKYIWTDPLFPAVGETLDYEYFDFQKYAREHLKAREHAESIGVFYGTFLACNFDKKTDYNCRSCLPVPHLTTDGYVSACDMALFGELKESEKHMLPFIYGRWSSASKKIIYDRSKMQKLRERKSKNMIGCKNCKAVNHCAGYCLGEVTNESGDMFGKKPQVCSAIRYLLKNIPPDKRGYEYLHP